jgi:hypothetical protein
VVEVLTHNIKNVVAKGRLRGIIFGEQQQIISQGTDDSSSLVRGNHKYVDELVRALKVFSEASSMEMDWDKHCAR